jgi:hypothetical protein
VGRFVRGPFGSFGYIGDEGEDCPICKAHGIPCDDDGGPEGLFIEALSREAMMNCPCPMCTIARFEPEQN